MATIKLEEPLEEGEVSPLKRSRSSWTETQIKAEREEGEISSSDEEENETYGHYNPSEAVILQRMASKFRSYDDFTSLSAKETEDIKRTVGVCLEEVGDKMALRQDDVRALTQRFQHERAQMAQEDIQVIVFLPECLL